MADVDAFSSATSLVAALRSGAIGARELTELQLVEPKSDRSYRLVSIPASSSSKGMIPTSAGIKRSPSGSAACTS